MLDSPFDICPPNAANPRIIAVLVLTVFILQACGISRAGSDRSADSVTENKRMLQEGVASWYGPNFHGKATANGERFNMNDLTAAHRTLPFNTVVQVVNLDNSKSVSVRINDRGPYVDNRVIDLSRKAAKQVDMEDSGTANVQIYLLEDGDRPVAPGRVTNQETFTIQLASYNSEQDAGRFSDRVKGSRIERISFAGKTVYRVFYGDFKTASEARSELQKLSGRGLDGFVKQVEN